MMLPPAPPSILLRSPSAVLSPSTGVVVVARDGLRRAGQALSMSRATRAAGTPPHEAEHMADGGSAFVSVNP